MVNNLIEYIYIAIAIIIATSASVFITAMLYINICTMLQEQIKGFYHGITKIFLLVGSYTMLSWHF